MRVDEIIQKAPKSVWTTSLYDLQMTPQEKALRAKATHDWMATKSFLALAKIRTAIAYLKAHAPQALAKPTQQGYAGSPLPTQQQAAAPTHAP